MVKMSEKKEIKPKPVNKKEKSNGGNENSDSSWGNKKKKAEDLKE